jgi:antitoxin component of MazEF toxin-antitoxin module
MQRKDHTTRIAKWGNGYGIRVPVAVLLDLSLTDGSEVLIEQNLHSISIKPKKASLVGMTLTELLEGVTPALIRSNHAETAFGAPQGKEIW